MPNHSPRNQVNYSWTLKPTATENGGTSGGTLVAEHHGGALIFTSDDLWDGPPGFSGTLYFTVPDAESYFAVVKHKVAVAWPLQEMAYGSREFGIKDCNGHFLAFQQQGGQRSAVEGLGQ